MTRNLYRTDQGYVVDDPATLMNWTPTSFFAIRDANGEQLRTIDTFLDMGKATSVRDLLARQDKGGGMPWVNTTAADRAGNALYADHSVVPNVSNALAQKCMTPVGRVLFQVAGLPALDGTRATSDCKLGHRLRRPASGIFGPKNLPATVRRDWMMNANDSYWLPNPAQKLEGFARIIGCEKCQRTLRTRMVDHYVIDALAKGKISPTTLRGFEHQNRVLGAEVMSQNGDLVKVCEAADGGDACPVLAAWDKHSDVGSRGNQIFEEFVTRLPTVPLLGTESYWQVPFDANDPVNTPRDLDENNPQVIQAMKDAIAYLASKNIPMNATWGSLQVAGDTRRSADPARRWAGRRGRQRQRTGLAQPGDQHREVQADHLRLLAHPGDLVPRQRRHRHQDDPHLRPVRGPDLTLVEGPDPDVRQEAVGQLPVHGLPDQQPADLEGDGHRLAELEDQLLDAAADLVADPAHDVDRLAGRVGRGPSPRSACRGSTGRRRRSPS